MLNVLTCLPWFKPPAARRCGARRSSTRPSLPTLLPTSLDQPPATDDERPLGCGWFDSSHELERGLQVHEANVQSLSALPLSDWLDLELRNGCGRPRQS